MSAKITQSLHLRAAQQLVMTPQLQQAIQLLQMNNLELDVYLETQLETNPLLEKQDLGYQEEDSMSDAEEKEKPDSMEKDFNTAFENEVTAGGEPGTGAASDFDAGSARIGSGGAASFLDDERGFEETLSSQKTLREHLTEQLYQQCKDDISIRIGLLLIDLLDDSGYLRLDIQTLSDRFGISMDRISHVVDMVRTFDPPGIFAYDLADCLTIQLKDAGKWDAPFEKLIKNLNMIASHNFQKLAHLCDVNETYLQDMIADVRHLNPKPAGSFANVIVQTAVPDVLMKTLPKNMGGGWRVELNNETLPRVLFNEEYYKDVVSHTKTEKDKSYLTTHMNDAHWLIRALDQRAHTILKVASEIVERQNAFFLYGIEFLVPMTLKDIADAIDMHESTVSRVTNGKFIGTPRGLFELKFFFTTGLAGIDGAVHSSESIKAKIKKLIDIETDHGILSDDAIADILNKDGIDIARRTVAKYREGMGIPTSMDRRKIKRNKARADSSNV